MSVPWNASTLRNLARLAGVLYLVIIVCGIFSEGVVRSDLVIRDDAAQTAQNLSESAFLFRLAFASDLVAFFCDAMVAVLLYVLLRDVSRPLALAALALRLLAHPAIGSLNLLNHLAALLSVGDPDASLFFMELHRYGYLIAGVFFGPHLLMLGYLIWHSPLYPRWLAPLLALAGTGYLIESFGNFLWPGHEGILIFFVAGPAVLGEFTLCFYLMIRGLRPEPVG